MRCCFHSFKDLLAPRLAPLFLNHSIYFDWECKGKSLYESAKNFLLFFAAKLFTTQHPVFSISSVIFRADGKDTIRIVMNKFFRDFTFDRLQRTVPIFVNKIASRSSSFVSIPASLSSLSCFFASRVFQIGLQR